ncbi:hypothetical protein KAK06_17295 [Ideonella sp. 4Y11]|uniref:Uncharacterized protein n=1 Tax=Ideonella aquatica TaxID=2824119 RepID=A0A940YJK9_9BURK|nr:hypothetical protein [Ideonella aquatica]MBQ0960714.1 hypothetical protein [Ideonella aquatica]
MWRITSACALGLLALVVGGCGGGGGGGTPDNPPDGGTQNGYPVLVTTADFQLPAAVSPPSRAPMAGHQMGQVRANASATVGAGVLVELLDARNPAAPVVLGSARTGADGRFDIAADGSSVPAPSRWLRAQLSSGDVIRAFAAGWTDLTPASESALSEVARLRLAGAFTAHTLTRDELGGLQDQVGLLWESRFGSLAPAAARSSLLSFLRYHEPWNSQLDNLALAKPEAGTGDISGLFPRNPTNGQATAVLDGRNLVGQITHDCHDRLQPGSRSCGVGNTANAAFSDSLQRYQDGLRLTNGEGTDDPIDALVTQIGELPLVDFPLTVGTKVLFENAKINLTTLPQYHASAKVTRRVYPSAAVTALSKTVRAVQVDLDYELAVLDTSTGVQTDVLARERRWFAPSGGRVRSELLGLVRSGGKIVRSEGFLRADSLSGDIFKPQGLPFAGVIDVVSLPLRHRHAVGSAARNRVYVAVDSDGNKLLEMNPDSLAISRQLALAAAPTRLAVSQDGTRLYAGLANSTLVEVNLGTMTVLRTTTLIRDRNNDAYEVYDLAVDPFDNDRVLVRAGDPTSFGAPGPVLIYRAGVLEMRDGPNNPTSLHYGWDAYSTDRILWTSTRDEFMLKTATSPENMYRMGLGATSVVERAALERVDDVGFEEQDGLVLTDRGRLLSAATLVSQGQLDISPWSLQGCRRQGSTGVFCELFSGLSYEPPYYVHLNLTDGAYLGAYRPVIKQAVNGCSGTDSDALGLNDLRLEAMDRARSVGSAIATSSGGYCALHVWTLHGVAR